MIEFEGVGKKFKADFFRQSFWVLRDINFSIAQGHVTGFLGANGAGKTTLIKILMGFIPATTGAIKFSEKLGQNREQIFSRLGLLPERPYFYPYLTGREFITYLSRLSGLKKSQMEIELDQWSKILQIDYALDRKIRQYSKGMLQRLGFISAIIHNPEVVILDEPLSGLDPIGRKEMKDAISELYRKGKTVFFSSHIIPDVEEICQRVVFLEKGSVVYEGSIDQIVRENIKPNFEIKALLPHSYEISHELFSSCKMINYYKDKQTQKIHMEVSHKFKDKLIEEILKGRGSIESLNLGKVGLEEIFYKIKGSHEDVNNRR